MAGNNLPMTYGFRGRCGKYNLLRTLGLGGFGKVFLGEHISSHAPAAVKVLHPHLTNKRAKRKRFQREAKRIAGLSPHPNVVRTIGYNVQSRRPYIIMEYAPNGNLRQRHNFGVKVPLPRVISYVRQLASGLQHVHSFGIVHCDVKPENMFVGSQGEIQIGDFGIAVGPGEDVRNEEILGSVYYISPDQLLRNPLPASDQYSLGVVVYEWLTGQVPFTGATVDEIADKHLHDQPPSMRLLNPAIPEAVEQVVMKALNKDPDQRYHTITDFAEALEAASTPERSASAQTTAVAGRGTPVAPHRPQSPSWRSTLHIALIVLILFGLLAFVFLLTPDATVTITETGLTQTWEDAISSVVGSTSSTLNPVAAHIETVRTAPQTKTAMATGKQTVPATQARGDVMFYNSDVVSHFIPAGSTIGVPHSWLLVATDIDVTIAAGVPPVEGHASVQAHVVQAGAAGNIAAGSLPYIICCSSPYIRVYNPNAFTGGQDAHTYAVVQQSDIDGAALALASMQKQSAPDLLRSQARPHELLAAPSVSCTPVVNPGAAAGSNATTVTVSVQSTCSGVFYNSDAVRARELSRFIDRENRMMGAMFAVAGDAVVSVIKAEVLAEPGNASRLVLHVVVTGTWRFNFTSREKQKLLEAIAGKTISEASALLVQTIYKPGVNKIKVRFSWNHPGFAEDRLPADTGRIMLEVVHR